MNICGVDPGKGGGIVMLSVENGAYRVTSGWKMPETDSEIVRVCREVCSACDRVYMELIPKFAGENRSAAIMSVLHENYALIRGAILMYQLIEKPTLSFYQPPPEYWMNRVLPRSARSRDRAIRKKQLKALAQEYWPDWKWTNMTCDAPLIAMASHLLGR